MNSTNPENGKKDGIPLVKEEDVIEIGADDRKRFTNVEPILDKLKYRSLGRSGFKTKNGSIILLHTPTYYPEKESYWDALYADTIIGSIDNNPNAKVFQAWYLKRGKHIHAVLIVPVNDLIMWFENAGTDKQNKWSFTIIEDLFENSYYIKMTGTDPIDITQYLNPFEQFFDKAELEQLLKGFTEQKVKVKEEKRVKEERLKKEAETRMSEEESIGHAINSCIEHKKKEKELSGKIKIRKESIIAIQDKIDSLKKELDVEKRELEDDERKFNICKEEAEKDEKKINDMIKTYIQKRVDNIGEVIGEDKTVISEKLCLQKK